MSAIPRLRDRLTWPSRIRYLAWRGGWRQHAALTVQVEGGPMIAVRPEPSTDLITAFEVFVSCLYDPPCRLDAVESICDLGANVGYSVLYFCRQFPRAQVYAFEPHPVHVGILRHHLELNHATQRVHVSAVAAGNAVGTAWLTDAGSSSEIVTKPVTGAHQISVVDWLVWAAPRTIDLLKMDIEGSERTLLADPRFASLRIRLLVLEWHFGDAGGQLSEATAPLVAAGYEILKVEQGIPSCVLIWARRAIGA